MRNLFSIFCLFFLSYPLLQAQSYDDVAILINSQSEESIEIGEYFQQVHNISEEHVIRIAMPTKEVLTMEEAENILTLLNPVLESINDINYIVSTMGCPRKYEASENSILYNSFESLIKDAQIGGSQPILSELEPGEFTQEVYGIYIVGRLEARTIAGTKALIDRGGENTIVNNPLIFDIISSDDNMDSTAIDFFLRKMDEWEDTNQGLLSMNIKVDSNLNLYQPMTFISGYFAYILRELSSTEAKELTCSTEGLAIVLNSFEVMDTSGTLFLSALDFTKELCHAAIGVVDEYYISQSVRMMDLLNTYYSINSAYNIGESFIISRPTFGPSQYVLYGDPKSTISFAAGTNNVSPFDFEITFYPNPSDSYIQIKAPIKLDKVGIRIYTIDGKKIMDEYYPARINNQMIDVTNLPSAEYIIEFNTMGLRTSKVFIKS